MINTIIRTKLYKNEIDKNKVYPDKYIAEVA